MAVESGRVRSTIANLDDFQVVRFFKHFAGEVFDAIRERGIVVADEIPPEMKSDAALQALLSLDPEKKKAVLGPEEAADCARKILVHLADHPSFRIAISESLESYSDKEMVADLILYLGYAVSMILVAATTTLHVSYRDGKLVAQLGKEVASPDAVKSVVQPVADVVRSYIAAKDSPKP